MIPVVIGITLFNRLQKNSFLLIFPVQGRISENDTPKNGTSPSAPWENNCPPITTVSYGPGLYSNRFLIVTKSLPSLLSLQLFCTMFRCNTDLVQVLACICFDLPQVFVPVIFPRRLAIRARCAFGAVRTSHDYGNDENEDLWQVKYLLQ